MNLKSACYYFLLTFFTFNILGCGSDEAPTTNNTDFAALRQNIANHVANHFILPAYATLATDANQLIIRADTFTATPTQANLDQLRAQLKAIWLSWQSAAIYQLGPVETNALQSAINIYPSDKDKIEANIISGNYVLGSIDNQDAQGFPAIDYLINQEDALQTLTDQKRIDYLIDLIDHVGNTINLVNDSWSMGAYLSTFTDASANGTDVGSAMGILINTIDMHFQQFVRDGKIAIPSGVRSAGVPRPTATEAFYGGYEVELLVHSLNAYLSLFKGNGFDGQNGESILSYLEKLEHAAIANAIENKFQETIQKAGNLNDPLSLQIEEDVDKVIEVFLSMQDLITLFKSDMASVMGITITNQDNDGD